MAIPLGATNWAVGAGPSRDPATPEPAKVVTIPAGVIFRIR
jgi:hypothetical protein